MPSLEDLTPDQLLAHARQLEGLQATYQKITQNADARTLLQQALKKVDPNTVIPELDSRAAIDAAIGEERTARLKLEREIQTDRIKARIEQERAACLAKYSLSAEDIKGVEALMVAETDPIPSYDAAARVFKASRTPATPTPASFQRPTYEMPEKEVWGKGIGNKAMLDKVALNEAYSAWGDIVGGKVAGLGGAR